MPPTDSGETPPNGPEPPRADAQAPADVLVALAEMLQELIPEDLQRRLAEAVRELLVALRALLDWLVERLERQPGGPREVRDIPIL